MFRLAAIFSVFSLMVSTATLAQPCRNINGNSCWHAHNHSNQRALIGCEDSFQSYVFETNPLASGQTYSEQKDMGYADGMGFSAAPLHCIAFIGNHSYEIHIPAMNFGSNIRFVFDNFGFSATVKDVWSRKPGITYESRPRR